MGKVTRKRYSADFKAKLVLEAIKGDQTLAELAAKYAIHHTMIAQWKRQAIEGMAATFSGKASEPDASVDHVPCGGVGAVSGPLGGHRGSSVKSGHHNNP